MLDTMLAVGPAVRALFDSAAATQIARDPVEATLLLKRLGAGLRLADLAPPDKRAEVEAVLAAVRRRAEEIFLDWARRREAPDAELRIGLDAYERCVSAEMESVLRDLTPAA